jgi:argininosuccinate lyase
VTLGHHLLAYVEMFARDRGRLRDARARLNESPLGSAALAGTSFPIDRDATAEALGFDRPTANSLDAVSDRDFAIEFCAAASIAMVHVSRFSEELVIWMSPRVGFIDLADRFCTGSSIMPQKKNPDVPELARGKTGRVVGHLMALLVLMKGQPLAYNKDNQEDKEPLFDVADTLTDTLRIFVDLVGGIQVKAARMRQAAAEGFSTATDLATKSGATTTLTATVSGKVKKFGKAVITVASSSGTPTGTVTVHKGTSAAGAVIGTGSLTAGTVTITNLTKQKKKGKVKLFIVYSGDGSYAASTKAVTWNVK